MALSPNSNHFVTSRIAMRLVDPSGGPAGPNQTVSYWLVPTNGYFGTERVPHTVQEELQGEKYDTTTVEGQEYWLVPESSTNTPGLLSHYAQRTGVADLVNPPGGGVNRARETFDLVKKGHESTVAPDAVDKYVQDNDSFEERRRNQDEETARINRAVSVSPAREPAEGKLVSADPVDDDGAKKGTKTSSEKHVKTTGETK